MGLAYVFSINKDIIEIKDDKDIKLLSQDLIDVSLETGRWIKEPKKHYLILKVAVSSLESHFIFIAFFNSHLMVSTCEFELSELFGLI